MNNEQPQANATDTPNGGGGSPAVNSRSDVTALVDALLGIGCDGDMGEVAALLSQTVQQGMGLDAERWVPVLMRSVRAELERRVVRHNIVRLTSCPPDGAIRAAVVYERPGYGPEGSWWTYVPVGQVSDD